MQKPVERSITLGPIKLSYVNPRNYGPGLESLRTISGHIGGVLYLREKYVGVFVCFKHWAWWDRYTGRQIAWLHVGPFMFFSSKYWDKQK